MRYKLQDRVTFAEPFSQSHLLLRFYRSRSALGVKGDSGGLNHKIIEELMVIASRVNKRSREQMS